ncbi:TPA: molybdopterin-guanine dinucleotide biosynthesis protein B [Candidatus Poribacteria bacterium]|nr:molybdopterin-guanine dinucleotide biosynthesis protein B [Candidatus Poribacteria bacterium]
MIPIISIVGKSNSGKTTLIEKLVPELKSRGLKVGTIKHDVHGFELDQEGKDTWRHAQAGVDTVVISSPQKAACIKRVDAELTLDGLVCQFLSDMDIVLTEGYKRQDKPKIEIYRAELGEEPLCIDDETLIAVVSDTQTQLDAPHFGTQDIERLADFILKRFRSAGRKDVVQLFVNGRQIPMSKRFTQGIFQKTIRGMVESLKGTEGAKQVRIFIDEL